MSTSIAASASTATFAGLLSAAGTRLADLQAHLGALDGKARIDACRTLGRAQLARLYDAAVDGEPLSPEHMVAHVGANGETARWYGKNSLPAFTFFEKHFQRHEGGIYGFNFNPAVVTFVSGPGYFACRVDESKPRELLIDYTKVPASAPAGWPRVKPNSAGLSRFVYKDMYDYCRRVTDEVVIGAATRLGKPIGQFFVLCKG